MYECEQMNHQLNDYYSIATSILHFLEKYLSQFHKALITYSIVLKHIHTKSNNLLNKSNLNNELTQHLQHAFLSLIQTFDDEYHQLEQRAKLVHIIQLTMKNLNQQINSSPIFKQKTKLHKYTFRIIRLNRNKKRQYLHRLIQQIRKHDKLTLTWKDNLDCITSQTTNLLWKLFSYSPYKFDVKLSKTPSDSLSISDNLRETIGDLSCTVQKDLDESDVLLPPIELGSGDQFNSKLIPLQSEESIPPELKQEQKQISNSNNALIVLPYTRESAEEKRSLYSTDIDETIIEKNQFHDDLVDDEDERWIKLVKKNEIQWRELTTTDQSSDDNQSITKRHKRLIKTKKVLHLSDISYTTDYYSQDESD